MNTNFKLLIPFIFILLSCDPQNTGDFHSPSGNIIFFNGLDETLSILDISEEKTYNNLGDNAITGTWPNNLVGTDYYLYITNSGSNDIYIMDKNSLELLNTIYLGKDNNPWMIIKQENNPIGYIPCYVSCSVIKVDLISGELLKTINIDSESDSYDLPEGGVIAGTKLYIGNTNTDTITVIDTETDQISDYLKLPEITDRTELNPQSLIYFKDLNEIHIVCTGKNTLSTYNDGAIIIYNTETEGFTDIIEIGGSPVYSEGAIDKTREIVYLSGTSGILAYNYTNHNIVNTGISGLFISGLIYIYETDKLYASVFDEDTIRIYSGENYSYEKSLKTGDGPQQLLYIE